MPNTKLEPLSASESSASDEESKLELYLQRQLEEDVARIFDESIYTDIELVCGKLKVLTHSCILKARTNKFYNKLEAILRVVNIERQTYEEIYSFISDVYTECDIKNQEKEIINYLKNNLFFSNSVKPKVCYAKEEEIDVFLTPKCISPYTDNKLQKVNSCTSPNTEITKEYYALVPIEGNLLDQELFEQDALSNAFQSIIKTQNTDTEKKTTHVKPTSLSLFSSHTSKTVKHSSSCDNIKNKNFDNILKDKNLIPEINKVDANKYLQQSDLKSNEKQGSIKIKNSESKIDKTLDSAYSPDSLITDEPSTSSDYLSAAFNCSPGLGPIDFFPHVNVGEHFAKMDNVFTSSDSGLENTGMLESLNSYKDVTLTDVSLTESALPESGVDDQNISIDCTLSSMNDSDQYLRVRPDVHSDMLSASGTSGLNEDDNNDHNTDNTTPMIYSISSKEEKQRLNEEIVILESSSVSSETGSWESVFPPKGVAKDICAMFLKNERHFEVVGDKLEYKLDSASNDELNSKPSSCFIDASSLVDDEDSSKSLCDITNLREHDYKADHSSGFSQPMPCSTLNKTDASPIDWSENIDNEDSLEQPDNKDLDYNQKDISPTIFEMTPITEDSLCTNTFENTVTPFEANQPAAADTGQKIIDKGLESKNILIASTPHNSIMSVSNTDLIKNSNPDEHRKDINNINRDSHTIFAKQNRYNESSPILSGGSSLVSHTPPFESHSSPLSRRRVENIPIVTGMSISNVESKQLQMPAETDNCSAWVVDMHKPLDKNKISGKKPGDKTCENIKYEEMNRLTIDSNNKSRGSVDSDSSEKSSHKFYIDLSSLPDPLPPTKTNEVCTNEKKNIFSMYIDLGDKVPVKDMPSRLSSSLQSKKQNDNKNGKSTTDKTTKSSAEIKLTKMSDTTTFEKYETLCNDPHISITEIIGIPEEIKTSNGESGRENLNDKKICRIVNGESKQNNIPIIHEEVIYKTSGDLFVKLSDLDKPVQKSETFIHDQKEQIDVRMTRSIPDNKWGEQNQSATSRSSEVLSSFHSENALSLNRLFPHLKNEFSKSMPGSLSAKTPFRTATLSSPGDAEDQISDVSELSSVQSSMCRSVVENSTTEDTSQTSSFIGNCQSRLGQDLLRMFLEEIAPDVIVEVSGKRIKAHKCILSSRCQYFAGILSGGWVESAGNVIVLPPFSFNVVHFALCHIYSGLSTIPDSISIVELATIADMLGLEGLKEAIMFTLKAKYCHHFHRPCQVCTAGVLECFPLSSVYGLDDLYRKCLRWITKYFAKVWPTKAFATLPKELLDKCYQEHIVNLSVDNLIDTVYGCGMTAYLLTAASLQNSRWAEIVARMCRRLVNAAAHFAAPRLVSILELTSAVSNEAPAPAKQALDDCLTAAIEWAPPDQTCRAYAFLAKLVKEIRHHQQYSKPDIILNEGSKIVDPNNFLYTHASSWRLQCEGTLVRAAPRVVGTEAFKDLPPDLRKRLRELGCIMFGPQAIPLTSSPLQERKCKSVYHGKSVKPNYTAASRSLDMEHVRNSFVPYKPKPPTVAGTEKIKNNIEPRDVNKSNKTIPPKVRTTKAQEERAKFNQIKTNLSLDRSSTKSSSTRSHPFENTKPRYLEPRPCKENDKKTPAKKLVNKIVSSSESSRNSSPIQARNLRAKGMKARESRVQAMSQDSLATSSRPRTAEPSTDSLSESQTSNKYATYTKAKHTGRGSVESVKSSKSNIPSMRVSNVRTKIPVYMNQSTGSNSNDSRDTELSKRRPLANTVANQNTILSPKPRNKNSVRNSLMSATKSSSAKMVPKIIKEPQTNKAKQQKINSKKSIKQQNDFEHSAEVPIMGRSGTFLKDEPTFGDKTTNLDVGE